MTFDDACAPSSEMNELWTLVIIVRRKKPASLNKIEFLNVMTFASRE